MRNASGHNFRDSSFIMDMAMGQIPRSTKRISSYVQLLDLLAWRIGLSGLLVDLVNALTIIQLVTLHVPIGLFSGSGN